MEDLRAGGLGRDAPKHGTAKWAFTWLDGTTFAGLRCGACDRRLRTGADSLAAWPSGMESLAGSRSVGREPRLREPAGEGPFAVLGVFRGPGLSDRPSVQRRTGRLRRAGRRQVRDAGDGGVLRRLRSRSDDRRHHALRGGHRFAVRRESRGGGRPGGEGRFRRRRGVPRTDGVRLDLRPRLPGPRRTHLGGPAHRRPPSPRPHGDGRGGTTPGRTTEPPAARSRRPSPGWGRWRRPSPARRTPDRWKRTPEAVRPPS